MPSVTHSGVPAFSTVQVATWVNSCRRTGPIREYPGSTYCGLSTTRVDSCARPCPGRPTPRVTASSSETSCWRPRKVAKTSLLRVAYSTALWLQLLGHSEATAATAASAWADSAGSLAASDAETMTNECLVALTL